MPGPRSASSAPRLTVDDWVQAGFATLAEEGLTAIKVDRLCQRLGVTKGSFYWHFDDIGTYLDALIAAWAERRLDDRRTFEDLGALPARERLSHMLSTLTSPQLWMLERAIREWGRSDPKVAAAVRTGDRWIAGVVRRAFIDAGFKPAEAEFRARACFAAGLGFIHLSEPRSSDEQTRELERFLDFMMRP
jgi:AcrR family transcriptional regulator